MAEHPDQQNRPRVLVVDDNLAQLRVLCDILQVEGFATTGVPDAAKAIAVIEAEDYPVAIVDHRLPDSTGTQLLEAILRLRPDTQVIIHTGYGSFDSAVDAVNLGAFAYVEKLGEPRELIGHVHRAIRSRISHELSRSESRLQSITDNAPDLIMQIDRRGSVLFSNRAPGALGAELLPSGRAEPVDLPPAVAEVFESGSPGQLEVAIGESPIERWYSCHIGPVTEGDKVDSVVVIARDVTEKRKAQQVLRDSNLRLELLGAISGRVADGMTVDELTRATVAETQRCLPDLRVACALIDEHGTLAFITSAQSSTRDSLEGQTLDLFAAAELEESLSTGEPFIVDDIAGTGPLESQPGRLEAMGVCSLVCAQLHHPSTDLGLLWFDDAEPHRWSEHEVITAREVAGHLSARLREAQAGEDRARWESMRSRYLEHIISAQEEERRRIARELHDEIGQTLTGLLVRLGSLEDAIAGDAARSEAAETRRLTSNAISELGRLARGLHPSILEDLGFTAAVQRLAEELTKTHGTVVDVHVSLPGVEDQLTRAMEITLYRVVQEALNNLVKHAGASTASIVVGCRNGVIRAIVEDDGCGFDPRQAAAPGTGGLGLHGIRERIPLLKGTVEIASGPGAGTTVIVEIPHR
jgi:signal transduction histidine kinase/ActR/RegA family two-component response regulator